MPARNPNDELRLETAKRLHYFYKISPAYWPNAFDVLNDMTGYKHQKFEIGGQTDIERRWGNARADTRVRFLKLADMIIDMKEN